jgi:hypothetical protein
VKHFVLDECDRLLAEVDMRRDVQAIFKATPHDKQVMMFSATLDKEVRPICRKFCQNVSAVCLCSWVWGVRFGMWALICILNSGYCYLHPHSFAVHVPLFSPSCNSCSDMCAQPMEIFVDDDTKLTLHGLQQYYIRLDEADKNKKLNDLLDALEFNQVVIFVSKVKRAVELSRLLEDCNFPSICIHSQLKQEERISRFKAFKDFSKRILVSTDLFGRGIDIERVNIVINYDFPDQSDQYLHRVGRAGRFGTKGECCRVFVCSVAVGRSSLVIGSFLWTPICAPPRHLSYDDLLLASQLFAHLSRCTDPFFPRYRPGGVVYLHGRGRGGDEEGAGALRRAGARDARPDRHLHLQ